MSTVYMTKEVTPGSLAQIYYALGISLFGNVAAKISTGEPSSRNFLQPELTRNLVQEFKDTVVECNIAYEERRNTFEDHWETMRDHGFIAIVPCDILNEEDHMPLLVTGGFHLTENYMSPHPQSYDSMPMLSRFRDHTTGGFNGALKNMSIGLVSSYGRIWIHSFGTGTRFEDVPTADHDSFLEPMMDVDYSVMDYMGRENIVYINVANHLSVDCGCDAHPHDPEMGDIGIFASADPMALDQACVNVVYTSEDGGKAALIGRIESQNGIYTVGVAYSLSLDNRGYGLRCTKSYQIAV